VNYPPRGPRWHSTPKGKRVVRELSLHHWAELRKEGPALLGALREAMGSFKET